MFDVRKPIVKVQVEIRGNTPSHDLGELKRATLALARDWSQKMITNKFPEGGWVRIRRFFFIKNKRLGKGGVGPGGPWAPGPDLALSFMRGY